MRSDCVNFGQGVWYISALEEGKYDPEWLKKPPTSNRLEPVWLGNRLAAFKEGSSGLVIEHTIPVTENGTLVGVMIIAKHE